MTRSSRRYSAQLSLLAFACVSGLAQSVSVTEYPIPTTNGASFGGAPYGITKGPDGALWFTVYFADKIDRITTTGSITEYPASLGNNYVSGITTGPDGALWYTTWTGNPTIGRITTSGVVTKFVLPPPLGGPIAITAGPDGALWFGSYLSPTLGRITTAGTVTVFPLPAPDSGGISGITVGPDGALWFTEIQYSAGQAETGVYKIGRATTGGAITEFRLPSTSGPPISIVAGPDGALWFTETNVTQTSSGSNGGGVSRIGRMTTGGILTEVPLPTTSGNPDFITVGPDGALWFTEQDGDKIGRITTAGAITEFSLPPGSYLPHGITTGPDGALWFADFGSNRIGRAVITASANPIITTNATLPSGTVGTFYSKTLTASGGVTPYSWSLISGALPSGLSLSSAGGITGTPASAGPFSFTARVTDAASSSATQTFSLNIGTSQNFTSALRVAQIVDGAGWATRFAIINTDQVPVTFTFQFWSDSGNALPFPILNGTPGVLSGTLAPGAAFFAQSPGTSSALLQGWAEVASSGKIGVTGIFQYSIGSSRDSIGSDVATLSGNRILMPFDNTQGSLTAIAIANTNPTQSLTVSMLFETDTGSQSSSSVVLQPHAHTAFVAPVIDPSVAGFRGSIQFTAPTSDMAVIGLEFTSAGQFTSLGTFQ